MPRDPDDQPLRLPRREMGEEGHAEAGDAAAAPGDVDQAELFTPDDLERRSVEAAPQDTVWDASAWGDGASGDVESVGSDRLERGAGDSPWDDTAWDVALGSDALESTSDVLESTTEQAVAAEDAGSASPAPSSSTSDEPDRAGSVREPSAPDPEATATNAGLDGDAGAAAEAPVALDAAQLVTAICPYLLSDDGGWRAARPMPDHRCTAVQPPAPLAAETQTRLCLATAHVECEAYMRARERRASELLRDRITPGFVEAPRFAPVGPSAPIAIDASHAERRPRASRPARRERHGDLSPLIADRRTPRPKPRWIVATVGLLATLTALAVVMLVVRPVPSRTPVAGVLPSPTEAVGTPTPRPASQAPPSPRPTRESPGPTAAPTRESPGPTTSSGTARTYRIQRGDSLDSIARRFGTTAAVLRELNGITDPRRLRVGQVLQLP